MAKRRRDVKKLETPADFRAIANPARVQLVDALYAYGQATVSQLAQTTELAIGSVSHHLRVLEAADIARRVAKPGSADRRQTWWEPAHRDGFEWTDDIAKESWGPAAVRSRWAAIQALDWDARRHEVVDEPGPWNKIRFLHDVTMRLTPEEVDALRWEIVDLLFKYRDLGDAGAKQGKTANRRPFHVDAIGFPYRPPKRR